MIDIRAWMRWSYALYAVALVLLVALFATQLAPHPEDAFSSDPFKRLKPPSAEFLLGTEHAEISVKDRAESLRPEIAPLAGAKPFREIKTVQPTVADVVKGIPEVIDQWRDTFGG